MTRCAKRLLAAALLVVAGTFLLLSWKTLPSEHDEQSPWKPASIHIDPGTTLGQSNSSMPTATTPAAPAQTSFLRHVRNAASDMTPQQKADFAKLFADKIKPAVQKWCAVYSGHVPFSADDVTADKLKERIFPDSPCQGYAFVIDGTTLCVQDNRGTVYVEYIMAPAAEELFLLSKGPQPRAELSISREEILRLLKADSGKEFPPSQIAIRSTSRATAMNRGVFVDAGEDVNSPRGGSLPQFSMVFGPDGNLAAYLRAKPEQSQPTPRTSRPYSK